MSAPAKRRNPFDGLTPERREEARRLLAELIDRQSRILGEPTPDKIRDYLESTRRP